MVSPPRFLRLLLVAIVALVAFCASSNAEDFRISTKIYRGVKQDKAKLICETTTLFLNGTVYDFLADGSQVAVFRKQADQPGRFILLAPEQRIQTEFTTELVQKTMEKLRTWARRQDDPMLKFAANPQFKESFDSENSQLILASHIETYTVTTQPASHPEAIAEYREFLQWYTQLNTLTSAGPPPEPRMRLNEAMARRRVIPQTVELTHEGDKEFTRAEHEFNFRLSRDDMDRVEEIRASLASFRKVELEQYRKAAEPPVEDKK